MQIYDSKYNPSQLSIEIDKTIQMKHCKSAFQLKICNIVITKITVQREQFFTVYIVGGAQGVVGDARTCMIDDP